MPIFWNQNTPQRFWLCEPPVSDAYWQEAIRKAVHLLDLAGNIEADELPALTLGEGRFGKDHWKLSWPKRFYYLFKPLLPRALTRSLRRYYSSTSDSKPKNYWPIELPIRLVPMGIDAPAFSREW